MKSLSPMENVLLTFMRDKGMGVDVLIYDMWLKLTEIRMVDSAIDGRNMQQYVGAFVSRVNNKQDRYEIVPGETKRTYCVRLKANNQDA